MTKRDVYRIFYRDQEDPLFRGGTSCSTPNGNSKKEQDFVLQVAYSASAGGIPIFL